MAQEYKQNIFVFEKGQPQVRRIYDTNGSRHMELAGRVTHGSRPSKTPEARFKFLKKNILDKGHWSLAEHWGFACLIPWNRDISPMVVLDIFQKTPELARGLHLTQAGFLLSGNIRLWYQFYQNAGEKLRETWFWRGVGWKLSEFFANKLEPIFLFLNSHKREMWRFSRDLNPESLALFYETILLNGGGEISELQFLGKREFIRKLALVTFEFEMSRAAANQLVRHRRPGYSQESLRVKEPLKTGHLGFVYPPRADAEILDSFLGVLASFYMRLRDARPEDRRAILGLNTLTRIWATTTIADWQYIIKERQAHNAQDEIRDLITSVQKTITDLLEEYDNDEVF